MAASASKVRGKQIIYSYNIGSRDAVEKQGKTTNMFYATSHAITSPKIEDRMKEIGKIRSRNGTKTRKAQFTGTQFGLKQLFCTLCANFVQN